MNGWALWGVNKTVEAKLTTYHMLFHPNSIFSISIWPTYSCKCKSIREDMIQKVLPSSRYGWRILSHVTLAQTYLSSNVHANPSMIYFWVILQTNKQTEPITESPWQGGGGDIAPYKDLFTFPSQTQIPPCHSEQWQQKQFLFFHITVTIEVCASFPHCHNHDHTASVVPLSKAGSPQHIHQEPQLCSRPEKLLRTKADIYWSHFFFTLVSSMLTI